MRYEWGRLNFHMAIDECMTRPDDADLGRWYREFCRDLLHQNDPKTMLGKDLLEEAKRLYEADRKKRQRELKQEKDELHNVPQCPTMSHDVPQCPDDVPKYGIGNGCIQSVLSIKVPKSNTVPARRRKKKSEEISEETMAIWNASPQRARERSSLALLQASLASLSTTPLLGDILISIEAWKASEAWTNEGGQFIPGIHKWIKDRKFEFCPEPKLDAVQEAQASFERIMGHLNEMRGAV